MTSVATVFKIFKSVTLKSVKPPMNFKRLQPHNNKTERKPSKFSLSCFHFIMSKANKWFLKAQMSRVFRFL